MTKFSNNMDGYRKKDNYVGRVREAVHGAASKDYKRPEKTYGPREKFLKAIKDGATVKQAIENTLEEMKTLKESNLIVWLKEELIKGNLSKDVMEKIKEYLDELEQESTRNSDDDAR